MNSWNWHWLVLFWWAWGENKSLKLNVKWSRRRLKLFRIVWSHIRILFEAVILSIPWRTVFRRLLKIEAKLCHKTLVFLIWTLAYLWKGVDTLWSIAEYTGSILKARARIIRLGRSLVCYCYILGNHAKNLLVFLNMINVDGVLLLGSSSATKWGS